MRSEQVVVVMVVVGGGGRKRECAAFGFILLDKQREFELIEFLLSGTPFGSNRFAVSGPPSASVPSSESRGNPERLFTKSPELFPVNLCLVERRVNRLHDVEKRSRNIRGISK